MNDFEKTLIDAVCRNDLRKAKEIAKTILERDKTQKNRAFVNSRLPLLNNSAMNLMELPANLQNILIMEDVSLSFNEERYFLSFREKDVAAKISLINKASQKLAELGIRYLNTVLLYGESGTGKTTFGRYIAYKMGVPFAYLNFGHAIDSYLGGTQKNISRAFSYVAQQKCVFMLDEIDAIGMRRGGREEVGEMSRIVITLMQCLDTLPNDVIVLGATNRPDVIDEALMRRFSTKHEIKRLDYYERKAMVSRFLRDVGYDYDGDFLEELCQPDRTQAELMSELIEALVRKYIAQ